MKLINPSVEILTPISEIESFKSSLELYGRVCYKSEDKITFDSSNKFIERIVNSGHHSVLEHKSITVKFIHNRGFSHELVRHRLASYSQESTRYCFYNKDKFNNELTFVIPYWIDHTSFEDENERTNERIMKNIELEAKLLWEQMMQDIEDLYLKMINYFRMYPQEARGILPNDLKTEIIMTANLREWMKVFELRCATSAHPDMRRIMIPLCIEFEKLLPEIFNSKKFIGE